MRRTHYSAIFKTIGYLALGSALLLPTACADLDSNSEATGASEQRIWTPDFERIAVNSASGPAISSWGPDRLDVFYTGVDSHLHHIAQGSSSSWSADEDLAGEVSSDPAAVSWGYNRVDVFVKGPQNHLYHRGWDGKAWAGWENLDGDLTSGPAVTSRGSGLLDVFVRGPNNEIWEKSYNSKGWGAWESIGGSATSDPAAAAWKDGQVHVFARGEDNAVWIRSWNGSFWSNWESLGGDIVGSPSVSSWATGSLDLYARGTDNQLYHRHYANGWGEWEALGGNCTSSPDSVSWGAGRVDAVVRGPDNALYRKVWTDRLGVPLIAQEQTNWCWAASAQMIAQWYGVNIAQCDQANNAFGRTDCCTNPSSPECNYWRGNNASTTFAHWGFTYTRVDGGLSDIALTSELTVAKRPVADVWAWTTVDGHPIGSAHQFVVTDHLRFAGDQFAVKNDPWPPNVGEQSLISLSALRSGPGYYLAETLYNIKKK